MKSYYSQLDLQSIFLEDLSVQEIRSIVIQYLLFSSSKQYVDTALFAPYG